MSFFLENIYKNKKVLITGHTGFKGVWLTLWLLKLKANVIGFSIDEPSKPSTFQLLKLKNRIVDIRGDVRNFEKLNKIIKKYKPEFIFHLAAQSLVIESFKKPHYTMTTNIIGSLNILELVRKHKFIKSTVIITSDKAYKNKELKRGYNENDQMFGEDPYSASKSAAENLCYSYFRSFFLKSKNIATARAGNVIGGGDWSKNRIIPDYYKNKLSKKKLIIRNPYSTRPWQHVLEPVGGYLLLAAKLLNGNKKLKSESFNFGPNNTSKNKTVLDIIKAIGKSNDYKFERKKIFKNKESILLQLNCNKVNKILNWYPVLNFKETCQFVKDWYENFLKKEKSMFEFSNKQIELYIKLSNKKKIKWLK